MSVSEERVREALSGVKYPGFSRDIVSFGLVKSMHIDNGDVRVQLAIATNDPNVPATIKSDAEKVLGEIEGVKSAKVLIDIHAPPAGAGAGGMGKPVDIGGVAVCTIGNVWETCCEAAASATRDSTAAAGVVGTEAVPPLPLPVRLPRA